MSGTAQPQAGGPLPQAAPAGMQRIPTTHPVGDLQQGGRVDLAHDRERAIGLDDRKRHRLARLISQCLERAP